MSFWLHLSAPPKELAGVDPFRDDEMLGDSDDVPAGVDPLLYERLQAAYDEALEGGDLVLDEELAALPDTLYGGDFDDLDEQMNVYAFEAPAGVDPDSYWRMADAGNRVADRVTRCFAGSAWLRRRFPARSYVQVFLLTTDAASAGVEYLTTESGPGGGDGPQGISCGLQIPTAWMAAPGDGLLGLRMFQAVLHALRAIGERYDIGMPSAVGPGADRGEPDVWDPFGPPPRQPSYADINAHLDRLTRSLRPDQLLLAAKEPVPATVARQCRTVCEALGTVVDQHTLTAPDTKATAWTIHTPS